MSDISHGLLRARQVPSERGVDIVFVTVGFHTRGIINGCAAA